MDWMMTVRLLWIGAVLPPMALMLYIYRKDKVEREPPRLLAKLLLGGVLAVIPAMLLEWVGIPAAGMLLREGTPAYAAVCCFLVVGAAEEGCKYFFLRRFSWNDPAFNYRFDAMVYAVFVSMGFALVENLLYVFTSGTLATALLRAVTAIPGHAAFAVFMGYCYGTERLYDRAALRCTDPKQAAYCRTLCRRFGRRALWLPVLIHGAYDFLLEVRLPWMGAAFLGFVVALDILAVRQVRKAERGEMPV